MDLSPLPLQNDGTAKLPPFSQAFHFTRHHIRADVVFAEIDRAWMFRFEHRVCRAKWGWPMGDVQLADRVLSVLEQSPHVPHRNLRFEANQGLVILRGVVHSYYQKQMAQEVLLGVEGVEQVENQLEVEWV
jgi:hypothetical protein